MNESLLVERDTEYGLSVSVYYDDDQHDMNPRTNYEHAGTMICWHRRADLGDETVQTDYYVSPEHLLSENGLDFRCGECGGKVTYDENFEVADNEWGAWVHDESLVGHTRLPAPSVEPDGVVLPLYLYEHSGMTMRVGEGGNPFSDRWDSGQVGFIFASRETIDREWGVHMDSEWYQTHHAGKTLDEVARDVLVAEVEEYDSYLRGEVYGYTVHPCGDPDDVLDSCWGFLGDEDYCMTEGKAAREGVFQQILDYLAAVERIEASEGNDEVQPELPVQLVL